MLNIELEDFARCYNPACRADIEPPGEQHRFCPHCGAAQVFECVACPSRPGETIRVAEDSECPRCGAMYVQCLRCFRPILVTSDDSMSCGEGCEAGLREARTGACEPLANISRTGVVSCRFSGAELSEPELWDLDEAISHPVCRFGRVFAGTARGTIRAINADTGRDADFWEQRPAFTGDAVTLGRLQLQVSERFVYFMDAGRITACSVVDGDIAFRMETTGTDAQAAISNDRLAICSQVEGPALRVEIHDTSALCSGRESLVREELLPSRDGEGRQPPSLPAATVDSFVLRDLDGNIIAIPVDPNKEFRPIWENPAMGHVAVPAVAGSYACILGSRPDRGTELVRVNLEDGSQVRGRVPGVRAAYLGPRVCSRHAYFFDGDRDYHEVDLANPAARSREIFVGIDIAGDMAMDALIALESSEGEGVWLVSLVGTPDRMAPRMVHTATQSRPTLNAPGEASLALTADDRTIYLANTLTGEILAYPIPSR